jgi:hypothetical protein
MPTGPTKADLEQQVQDAADILNEAYRPEATREQLAEAVGNALSVLDPDDDQEDEEDDEEDDAAA